MAINYFRQLSQEAKKEFVKLVKNKESAYDMILGNYLDESIDYCASDISSRLEVQYFALKPILKNIQSKDMNGWAQNESYEPNEVNEKVISLMEAKDKRGVVKKYYSSFALKEVDNKYTLTLPLDDDYTEAESAFVGMSMQGKTYNYLMGLMQEKYGLTIKTVLTDSANQPSRQPSRLFGLFNRNNNQSTIVTLADRTYRGYTYSNVEKFIKVLDTVCGLSLKRQTESFKDTTKDRISNDLIFAARIFATFLISRAVDYGDTKINETVEKCLWLQFASIINRGDFNSSELKVVTELGASAAADVAVNFNMDKEAIQEALEQNGYSYYDELEPTNIKEALLYATDYSYAKYTKAFMEALNNERTDATRNTPIYEDFSADMKEAQLEQQKLLALIGDESVTDLIAGNDKKPAQIGTNRIIPKEQFFPQNTDLLDGLSEFLTKNETQPTTTTISFEGDAQTYGGDKFSGFNKNAVRQRTVDGIIANIMEKAVRDKTTSIIRAINRGDSYRYGGKGIAESLSKFLANTLIYFENLQVGITKDESIKKYNYKNSLDFAIGLNKLKQKILDGILEYSKTNPKTDSNMKLETYINIAYKNQFNSDITLRESIKKLINDYSEKYVADEKQNGKDNG